MLQYLPEVVTKSQGPSRSGTLESDLQLVFDTLVSSVYEIVMISYSLQESRSANDQLREEYINT